MSYFVAPSKIDLTSSVAVDTVIMDDVVDIFFGKSEQGGELESGVGLSWN